MNLTRFTPRFVCILLRSERLWQYLRGSCKRHRLRKCQLYIHAYGRGSKHTCGALMPLPMADCESHRDAILYGDGVSFYAALDLISRRFGGSAVRHGPYSGVLHLALNLSRAKIVYSAPTVAFNGSIDREILSSNIRCTA